MLIRFIPKEGGGWRPIGLLRGCFRLYQRARSTLVRRWAQDNIEACFNNDPGRRTGDSIWRSRVRGMTRPEDHHAAEILWDITKCYEHVNHEKLRDLGLACGFPAQLHAKTGLADAG